MWTLNRIKITWSIVLAGLMMLTSCLDDGEETISLEQGDPYEMITGKWSVVSASVIYEDEDESQITSDLPDDDRLWATLDFSSTGTYTEQRVGSISADKHPYSLSGEPLDYVLQLNGNTYEITSMGKKKMYLRQYVYADGVYAAKQYVLNKIGDSEEAAPVPPVHDQTTVVSSDEYKVIQYGGYALTVPKGAVPKNDKGEAGKVAFSFQMTDELPAALPSNLEFTGKVLKVEPLNFTFSSPLTLKVPAPVNSGLLLYQYDAAKLQWVLVPFSSQDATGATVNITGLGYFVLVKERDASHTGGIRITISDKSYESGYLYYATIYSVNGNNAAAQNLVGTTAAAQGRTIYFANVPMNVGYNIRIVREKRRDLQNPATQTEYTTRTVYTFVSNPLTVTGSKLENFTGWTNVTADFTSSDWQNGRPGEWGTVTTTYGTGKFQATLTWVNTGSNSTDYDLHLYGPDNLHVYFGSKRQGCFELDRDWLHAAGNATENLYSIDDNFPAGNYTVKVHHYGGVTGKPYNCRIIVNNTVVVSRTGAIQRNGVFDDIYHFTIQ